MGNTATTALPEGPKESPKWPKNESIFYILEFVRSKVLEGIELFGDKNVKKALERLNEILVFNEDVVKFVLKEFNIELEQLEELLSDEDVKLFLICGKEDAIEFLVKKWNIERSLKGLKELCSSLNGLLLHWNEHTMESLGKYDSLEQYKIDKECITTIEPTYSLSDTNLQFSFPDIPFYEGTPFTSGVSKLSISPDGGVSLFTSGVPRFSIGADRGLATKKKHLSKEDFEKFESRVRGLCSDENIVSWILKNWDKDTMELVLDKCKIENPVQFMKLYSDYSAKWILVEGNKDIIVLALDRCGIEDVDEFIDLCSYGYIREILKNGDKGTIELFDKYNVRSLKQLIVLCRSGYFKNCLNSGSEGLRNFAFMVSHLLEGGTSPSGEN